MGRMWQSFHYTKLFNQKCQTLFEFSTFLMLKNPSFKAKFNYHLLSEACFDTLNLSQWLF